MDVDSKVVYAAQAAADYLMEYSAMAGVPVHCPDMPHEVACWIQQMATRFCAVKGLAWWSGELDDATWTVSTPHSKEIDAFLSCKN